MCEDLKQITVDSQNESFKSVGGVLYNTSISILYKYPTAKDGIDFNVPTSVNIINDYAFSNSRLEQIILPSGLKTINTGAFDECKNLKEIVIPKGVTAIGMFAFHKLRVSYKYFNT